MAIRKGYIETKGGQIHFRQVSGGSGIPIMMFHMTASTSESYDTLLTQLDGHRQVIAVDTPNYGESFKTTTKPSMEYIASVMIEVADALGFDRFHVLGHHTGASIAVELAAAYPDRIQSVVLCGLVYSTPEENAALFKLRVVDLPIAERGEQLMWAWTRVVKYDSEPLPPEIANREVADTLKAGAHWHWAYQAVFAHDPINRAKMITCPIFLVCGERDPVWRYYERAVKEMRHTRAHAAAGHGLSYLETGASEFAPMLLEFVNAHDQS